MFSALVMGCAGKTKDTGKIEDTTETVSETETVTETENENSGDIGENKDDNREEEDVDKESFATGINTEDSGQSAGTGREEKNDVWEFVLDDSIEEFCPAAIAEPRDGVTYGEYTHGTYFSKTCGLERGYNILLPAGYSEDKQYPVLYLLHGIFGNEYSFSGDPANRIKEIVGNMTADGIIEETIVVCPNMFATTDPEQQPGFDAESVRPYDNFINDLIKDLMPHIEKTYSVKTGRDNTAITGFSMGGRESLLIGTKRPDLFSYIGAICPAPGASTDFKLGTENDPHLIYLTAGTDDKTVYTIPVGYHDDMVKKNIPHVWQYVQGGYHGDNSIHAHLYNFVRYIFKA